MASASRPTAKMSSADALAAMRNSGSTRASAARAGSSEGNGLSVTAINLRGICSFLLCRTASRPAPSLPFSPPSPRKRGESGLNDLRVDAIGRRASRQQRKDVVHHDKRHLLTYLCHRAAEMGGRNDVAHGEQCRRHLRLMLENVETGAGDLTPGKCTRKRRLVDNGAARRVDEKSCSFHLRELSGTNLMPCFRPERRMDRDKIGLRQQLVERCVGQAGFALEACGLSARRPVEHSHVEAAGTACQRATDAATAADQAKGLAVDGR